MAGNIFSRYLWLVNVIRSHAPITYKEISRRWEDASCNDYPGSPLPLKTFHRHCEKIAEIFGVEVVCDPKNGYTYSLDESYQKDRWISGFLDNLSIQNAIEEDSSMRDRILVKSGERNPYLTDIIEYIKKRELISFRYHLSMADIRNDEDATEEEKNISDFDVKYEKFLPLGIVYIGSTWFVIFGANDGVRISVFRLQMLHDISSAGRLEDKTRFVDWSTKDFISTFSFSIKDNDFIDERMVLAMELGTLRNGFDTQKKFSSWSQADIELREAMQSLILKWDLPRKKYRVCHFLA